MLTKSLTALRNNFNEIAPNRDKASDGTIGDPAHQKSKSGHNPDDTPGVVAEYSDADSKQEVRAIDVDVDLRQPNVTMLKVIQSILADPNARKRLKYIIYNRVIWSKNNGWRSARYTGANAHDKHAHFSGDPADDENSANWPAVLKFKEDAVTDAEMAELIEKLMMHDITSPSFPNGKINVRDLLKQGYAARTAAETVGAAVAALETKVGNVSVTLTDEDIAKIATQVAPVVIAALKDGAFLFTENPAK